TNARGARWTARNGDLRGVPLEFAAARGDATSVHAWTRGRRPSGGVPAGCSKPANSGTAEAWCLAVVPRGDAARPHEKRTPVGRSLRAEGVEAPRVEPRSGSRCVRRLRV